MAAASTSSKTSDAVVDEFLSSVLSEVKETRDGQLTAPSQQLSAPLPAQAPLTSNTDFNHSAALAKCRELFLPQIVLNAQRRNPDVETAILTQRASALLTDDWCEEMLAHARRVRAEMRERNLTFDVTRLEGQQATSSMGSGEAVASATDTGSSGQPASEQSQARGATPAQTSQGHAPFDMSAALESATRIVESYVAQNAQNNADIPSPLPIEGPPQNSSECVGASAAVAFNQILDPQGDSAHIESSVILQIGQSMNIPESISTTSLHDAPMQVDSDAVPAPAKSMDEAHQAATQSTTTSAPISDPVPGVWALTVGSPTARISYLSFSISGHVADSARRWGQRRRNFEETHRHVAVHLQCLPRAHVLSVHESLDPAAPPADFAAALWDVQTTWPERGTFVVDINHEGDMATRTFLPADLGRDVGALDISALIHSGLNTIRLIQLQSMSDYVFVVHAGDPSKDECQRAVEMSRDRRDWAAFMARSSVQVH